jgi:hypothetical protein
MGELMFEHVHLKNPGLTRGMLPPEIYEPVMQEIQEIQQDDSGIYKMNKTLAGQIEKEYQLEKSKPHIVPYLEEMGRQYCKHWDYYPGRDLKVDSLWVNLQKKTEYNPIHNHDGALSYVCWLKVPYTLEDELKQKHSEHSRTKEFSASFQFIYSSVLGKVVNEILNVENGWEGRVVMFPAELLHVVYPFYTSNGYRISIAGNLS